MSKDGKGKFLIIFGKRFDLKKNIQESETLFGHLLIVVMTLLQFSKMLILAVILI